MNGVWAFSADEYEDKLISKQTDAKDSYFEKKKKKPTQVGTFVCVRIMSGGDR